MSVLTFSPPVPGRTVDAVFLKTDTPFQMSRTVQKVFQGQGGEACTGVYKLAQRVLLRLLTPAGREPYGRDRGTQLVTELLMHQLRTVPDVQRAFFSSREQLLNQFTNDLLVRSATPLDEQLKNVELTDVQIQNRELHLGLKVISRAGEAYQFIAPIPLR